jgi:hypothetical protein
VKPLDLTLRWRTVRYPAGEFLDEQFEERPTRQPGFREGVMNAAGTGHAVPKGPRDLAYRRPTGTTMQCVELVVQHLERARVQ